jgi:hypothetical protein
VLSLSGIALVQLEVVPMEARQAAAIEQALAPNPAAEAVLMPEDWARLAEARQVLRDEGVPLTTRVHFFSRIGAVRSILTPAQWEQLARQRAPVASFEIENDDGGWLAQRTLRGLGDLATDPAALNQPLSAWIPRVLFLLVPVFAGLLALFHLGLQKSFLFVDHLVPSLNVHSFGFVALMIGAIAAQFVSSTLIGWATLFAVLAYVVVALRRFYGQSRLRTGVKFVAVTSLYIFFFLIPSLIAVLLVSMTEA